MTHHLVGVAEIAEMLGVSRSRVTQLVAGYPDFPAPDAELASGRIWSRTAVERWIRSHPSRPGGRRPAVQRPPNDSFFAIMTDPARQAIVLAQESARLLGHPRIGCEHLLLGLARESTGVAHQALLRCGLDEETLLQSVTEAAPARKSPSAGHLPFTAAAKKALEASYPESLARDEEAIDTQHVLLGLFAAHHNLALRILRAHLDDPMDTLTAAVDAVQQGAPAVSVPLPPEVEATDPLHLILDRLDALTATLDRRLESIESRLSDR